MTDQEQQARKEQFRAAREDVVREKPVLERRREWEHGGGGLGDKCGRARKPIYTNPNEAPGVCRDWYCDNTEYRSKGIVVRDQKKNIVHREK